MSGTIFPIYTNILRPYRFMVALGDGASNELASSVNNEKSKEWLEALGYTGAPRGLYLPGKLPPPSHAYRSEVEELLDSDGPIHATAVFDVEGVPAVCFLDDDGRLLRQHQELDRIREKIWNQNLISVILVIQGNRAVAVPVSQREEAPVSIDRSEASAESPFSVRDIQAGDIFHRHKSWFEPENRVDRVLLHNLLHIVEKLETFNLTKLDAQYLMAQTLFISYLEHRSIVGDTYRSKHGLGQLHSLIRSSDTRSIVKLLKRLKRDFNGDFLEAETKDSTLWTSLSPEAFSLLDDFLSRTDLETRQQSLWNYDFRYIPVELISGIYESFLSEEKRDVGAYYTPRHLANLAVDCAFEGSEDILNERIYDGACGSGILLTTAYRRMLSYARVKLGRPLEFSERRQLLERNIFGSDINESACRVTAFSLYLSMLEGLQPSDIAELQENENVKLPSVGKKNIIGGEKRGDFFSGKNPHASSGKFTILISNPPWVEPRQHDWLGSDAWAEEARVKIPRRQTAGAFMLRARDCLVETGRLCFILPASIVAGRTSSKFLGHWLENYKLNTLINFGDLRKVLFDTAKQPCVIAVAQVRSPDSRGCIPGHETFEYWVPKADVSFAFGRLSLHSGDRHRVQSQLIAKDNELLTTLFWGTDCDVATITALRLNGTLEQLIGKGGCFPFRKGFHRQDASVANPVEPKAIRKMPFLDAKMFSVDGPVLDTELLTKFPPDIETVTRLPDELLAAFKGPKIVFTDGISHDRKVRAAFSDKAFSFSSSIGVIAGKRKDESILRFLATYLHSNLVQYVLLLTAYQINFERERVTLHDIKQLPFVHPDSHANPEKAWSIVNQVAKSTIEEQNNLRIFNNETGEKAIRCRNALIYDYFGLSESEICRIEEVSLLVAPNLQPSSVLALGTTLQGRPATAQVSNYAKGLAAEIDRWSRTRCGRGGVEVEVMVNSQAVCGAVGVIKVTPRVRTAKKSSITSTEMNDKVVNQLLRTLHSRDLLPMSTASGFDFIPDTLIQVESTFFLIKPLVSRLWLLSEASKDANRIVNAVLSTARQRDTG